MLAALLVLSVLQATPVAPAAHDGQGEVYAAVSVDKNGALAIRRADGSIVAVYRRRDQTTFEAPRLSPDRKAVGALAMYPNCCTSYDIPLGLVVYENGREHWFRGGGLPIFWWMFADGGRRVAFGQATVHGSCSTGYELRDIRTEQLIETADVPDSDPGCPPAKPVQIPDWVKRLRDASRR